MALKSNKCVLVRLAGRQPFPRCVNCSRSLWQCFVVRTTLVSLVIIGLVLMIADFSLLSSRLIVSCTIALLVFLAIEINRETNNLAVAESKAREHLAEVKTLRGIIPICAHCKNICDDKGAWNQLEQYIRAHSLAEFSHGICPKCAQKLYPDYWQRHTKNKTGSLKEQRQ